MVASVECYAGKSGAQDRVKLEDEIRVTADGPVQICHYPYREEAARLMRCGASPHPLVHARGESGPSQRPAGVSAHQGRQQRAAAERLEGFARTPPELVTWRGSRRQPEARSR